jgi:hypothetical protein
MADRTEAPTERDKLLLVRGVNARVADQLEQSGYSSAEAIASEGDADRLAIKSGLGATKAQALRAAVAEFLDKEWPPVEVKMNESVAAAQAEAARLEAEAKDEAYAKEAAEAMQVESEASSEARTASEPEAEAETLGETKPE